MKNIGEKEIIGNDMKNYINFVKKNLKRKMKKGEKYYINNRSEGKKYLDLNNDKNIFLDFTGVNDCMLLFESEKGYKLNILIKDICLGVKEIKNLKGEIIK